MKLISFHQPAGALENGTEITKNYYVSTHYKESWAAARGICRSNGMDLMTIDSEDEKTSFGKIFLKTLSFSDQKSYHIGGILETAGNHTTWHWIATKEAVKFPVTAKPASATGDENNCMTLEKKDKKTFTFGDVSCCDRVPSSFLCETKAEKV